MGYWAFNYTRGIPLAPQLRTCMLEFPTVSVRLMRDSVIPGQAAKGLTMPCGCLIISKGRSQARRKRRREMSYIAI